MPRRGELTRKRERERRRKPTEKRSTNAEKRKGPRAIRERKKRGR